MIRVRASDVIGTQRRQILDDRINRMAVSYQDKLAYVQEEVSEFLCDIFGDIEGNFEYALTIGNVLGFETSKDFYNGKGIIQSRAVLTTPSGRRFYVDINTPLYKGSLYKPSVISIDSNIVVFSSASVGTYVDSAQTVRPKMYHQYLPERKTYRFPVIQDSMFNSSSDDFYSEDGPVVDMNY